MKIPGKTQGSFGIPEEIQKEFERRKMEKTHLQNRNNRSNRSNKETRSKTLDQMLLELKKMMANWMLPQKILPQKPSLKRWVQNLTRKTFRGFFSKVITKQS
jgi:hypothetical protein